MADDADGFDVWARLERSPLVTPTSPSAAPPAPGTPAAPSKPTTRNWLSRLPLWVFDVLGVVAWAYVLVKIFVADVDRALVELIAPGAVAMVDYRVVLYLLVIAVVAIFWRSLLIPVLWIVFYPLVFIFFRVPLYLVGHRSWPLFLSILQSLSVVLSDLRYNLVTKALAIVASVLIVLSAPAALVLVSALYIAALLAWSFWRRVRTFARAPSFVEVQRKAIRRVVDSSLVQRLINLTPEQTRPDIQEYAPDQAQQVALVISSGIALSKVLYLWSYQLERYRRRFAPSLLFNALTGAWVLLASVFALALLNTALLRLAPDELAVPSPRPFVAVLVYAFSTLTPGGTAGGIQPVGDIAYVLQLLGAFTGVFVVGTFLVTVVVTYATERDDTATQALVAELRQEARAADLRFTDQYRVSVDEAYRKLRQMGAASTSIATFLIQSLPPDVTSPPP